MQKPIRSEEHTSELQSRSDLVCRLLLEKKKTHNPPITSARLAGHETAADNSEANNLHPHFFFFNDTATTEIYTLSLHDALPISTGPRFPLFLAAHQRALPLIERSRSEEHTSVLQSRSEIVCRLLLETTNQL